MRHAGAHDGELVCRTLDGDRTAFDQLVARYRNTVYGLAYHMLDDFGEPDKFEEAEDAAQDAFISAYLKLHQLKTPRSFAAWLRSITHNVCSNRMRSAKRLKTEHVSLEDMASPSSYDPGRYTETRETQAFIRRALRSLPEKSRLTLTMCLIDGFSYAEISGFLNVSIGTVKSRLNYAKKKLREELYPMVEDHLNLHELDDFFNARVREEIDKLLMIIAGKGAGDEKRDARDKVAERWRQTPDALADRVRACRDGKTLNAISSVVDRLGAPACRVLLPLAVDTDQEVRKQAIRALPRGPVHSYIVLNTLCDMDAPKRQKVDMLLSIYLNEGTDRGFRPEEIRAALCAGLFTSFGNEAAGAFLRILGENDSHRTVDKRLLELIPFGESRIGDGLVNWLKEPDERLRKIALRALTKAMDQSAEEPAIGVLVDGDDETRLLLCRLLAVIGSSSAIRPLLSMLKDGAPEVQAAAALALGMIAPGGKRGMTEREKSNAAAVWTELDEQTTAEIVHNLDEALRTGIPAVRSNAATALGMKGAPDAIEALAAALDHEQDRQVLNAIINALKMTYSRRGFEACVAFGKTNREVYTGFSCKSRPLQFYDPDEWESLCRDTDAPEDERAFAVGLLYKAREDQALDLMLDLLSDPSNRVVKAVEGEISNRLPELARDDPRAHAVLENMAAGHSSPTRKRWAQRELTKLANPPEEQALADLAAQARTWKAQDAKMLAQSGSPRALEALRGALADANPLLCASAMEGLMLSDAPFSRKMIEAAMTQDRPPLLRHYAKLIMAGQWRGKQWHYAKLIMAGQWNFGVSDLYWQRHPMPGARVFALLPPRDRYPTRVIEDAMTMVHLDHNAGIRALADFGLIERSQGVCRLTEGGHAAMEVERAIWEAVVGSKG